jgi:Putative peptidoglycan binding domain
MAGYFGFRIAEDVPVGNESPGLIGIEVKLKSPTPVLSKISFPPTLARGSVGSVVSALQKALKEFRGPNTPTDPGAIDGDFGQRTESAVRAYQSEQNITVDGIVGNQTWWVPAGAAGATLASLADLV